MTDKYLRSAADEWTRLGEHTGIISVSSRIARALGVLFEAAATRPWSDETGPGFDALAELTIGKTRDEFNELPEDEDEAYWRSILNDPQGRVPEDDDLTANALFE